MINYRRYLNVRCLLVLGIEIMALCTLWLRDTVLAGMLQALAILVLSVDRLDRSLDVADRQRFIDSSP